MNNSNLLSNYYQQHREELTSYIALRISDAIEAEDIVQDIFLHLLRGSHLITQHTLAGLLYTMARHAVSDYHRRRAARQAALRSHLWQQTACAHSTEAIVAAHQIEAHIERTLSRLPEACCPIYRLHLYDGLKVSDIATQLALPYKQVEHRLGQARQAVRHQLRCCV